MPEFLFSFYFLFLTPSVGSLNYLAAVTDPEGVQGGSEQIISIL